MTVYEVWDHDPMDGSYGKDYLAKTFLRRKDAEAEVERRNAEWRAYWIANASDGARRVDTEPWNWRHARMESRRVE